jgi:hypothetical protein
MHHLWSKADYEISTDPARVDLSLVHEFLTNLLLGQRYPAGWKSTVQMGMQEATGSFQRSEGGDHAFFLPACQTFLNPVPAFSASCGMWKQEQHSCLQTGRDQCLSSDRNHQSHRCRPRKYATF